MRKDIGVKPCIYPEPVLIIATYNEDGTPCAMNAAWGGISEENEISMCLSPEHKTVENILARGAFTVILIKKKKKNVLKDHEDQLLILQMRKARNQMT